MNPVVGDTCLEGWNLGFDPQFCQNQMVVFPSFEVARKNKYDNSSVAKWKARGVYTVFNHNLVYSSSHSKVNHSREDLKMWKT